MKTLTGSLAAAFLALVSLFASSCGGSPKTKLETTELSQAFASADAALKAPVDQAVAAFKGGKLLEGSKALAQVASSAEKLSDEQKTAMVNLVANIQTIMAEDGNKADNAVYQALEDMMAGLDGREAPKVGTNPDAVRPPKITGE